MKKGIALLSSLILAGSLITAFTASADIGDSMKAMSKSYRAVMKDQDAASFKKDLTAFRAAAVEAQGGQIGGDKATQFAEGMKELIDQVDVSMKLVDEGKVADVKKEAAKLKDLMKEYHGKLGV